MKKLISSLMSLLLLAAMVSSAFAIGENDADETSCDAVNSQVHKDTSSSSDQSQDASVKSSGKL